MIMISVMKKMKGNIRSMKILMKIMKIMKMA